MDSEPALGPADAELKTRRYNSAGAANLHCAPEEIPPEDPPSLRTGSAPARRELTHGSSAGSLARHTCVRRHRPPNGFRAGPGAGRCRAKDSALQFCRYGEAAVRAGGNPTGRGAELRNRLCPARCQSQYRAQLSVFGWRAHWFACVRHRAARRIWATYIGVRCMSLRAFGPRNPMKMDSRIRWSRRER